MGLFRRKIDPCCSYCQRGVRINEREIMCHRRGIVPDTGQCRSFCYDPLKRTPPRPAHMDTKGLKPEDFIL